MEEEIRKAFDIKAPDIRTFSPLALAYIGDSIYDLVIRTVLLGRGNMPSSKLHRLSVRYVSAPAQSKIISYLMEDLEEEEMEIYMRGRNAKPHTVAKNADVSDYHAATGYEALLGYLYLKGRNDRLLYLIRKGVEYIDNGK